MSMMRDSSGFFTFTFLLSFLTLTVSTVVVCAALLEPGWKVTHPPTAFLSKGIIQLKTPVWEPSPTPGAKGRTLFPLSLQEQTQVTFTFPHTNVCNSETVKHVDVSGTQTVTYRIMVSKRAWCKPLAVSAAPLRRYENDSSSSIPSKKIL